MEFFIQSFLIILYAEAVYLNILKQAECSIYDAEFSKIKKDVFLNKTISLVLNDVSLVQCETQCTVHPKCLSVNYKKTNSLCQLVNGDQKCGVSENWVNAPGWTHYGTVDKKAIGPWCTNSNPCSASEVCEDRCGETHICILQRDYALLNSHVIDASQYGTTFQVLHPPWNALDGNHATFQHTGYEAGRQFWKVVFDERIFISQIRIIEQPGDCCMGHNGDLNIKTTVINSGFRVDAICANTGFLGEEKTLDCNEFAEELEIFREISIAFHLADVYIYGRNCFV